ncbi:hypothetical protein YERSI8AC_140015 [Enterobacterales bacterium 8AC]|nr:hypothetical protein YERSI8AC_140015 [Enterobacterales bacterium 8AC]
MKNWKKFALKLHRYLSYLMFIQLFLWILGGVVFSVIPFNEITKSGNVLVKPTVILPTGWQKHLSTLGSEDITNITTFVSAIGPAYRLQQASGNVLTMTIDGQSFSQVTEEQVSQFAKTLHQGDVKIQRMPLWLCFTGTHNLGVLSHEKTISKPNADGYDQHWGSGDTTRCIIVSIGSSLGRFRAVLH